MEMSPSSAHIRYPRIAGTLARFDDAALGHSSLAPPPIFRSFDTEPQAGQEVTLERRNGLKTKKLPSA